MRISWECTGTLRIEDDPVLTERPPRVHVKVPPPRLFVLCQILNLQPGDVFKPHPREKAKERYPERRLASREDASPEDGRKVRLRERLPAVLRQKTRLQSYLE
jgi:hypothetical protein